MTRTGRNRWALMELFDIPNGDGVTYLRRWRLVQTPLVSVYLHRFYLPDWDRDPHDHPWAFVSVVLRGGYEETLYERGTYLRRRRRRRGSVALFPLRRAAQGRDGSFTHHDPRHHRPCRQAVGFLDVRGLSAQPLLGRVAGVPPASSNTFERHARTNLVSGLDPRVAELSSYPHPAYRIEYETSDDGRVYHVDHVASTLDDADVLASRITGSDDNDHTIMLDLDVPARLVSSSTPGHSHLYIDVRTDWATYERLLHALVDAGVLEPGYVAASESRGYTSLRLPWVRKKAAPIGVAQPATDKENPAA